MEGLVKQDQVHDVIDESSDVFTRSPYQDEKNKVVRASGNTSNSVFFDSSGSHALMEDSEQCVVKSGSEESMMVDETNSRYSQEEGCDAVNQAI